MMYVVSSFAPRATVTYDGPYWSVNVGQFLLGCLPLDKTLVQMAGKQFPNKRHVRSFRSIVIDLLECETPYSPKIYYGTLASSSQNALSTLVGYTAAPEPPGIPS